MKKNWRFSLSAFLIAALALNSVAHVFAQSTSASPSFSRTVPISIAPLNETAAVVFLDLPADIQAQTGTIQGAPAIRIMNAATQLAPLREPSGLINRKALIEPTPYPVRMAVNPDNNVILRFDSPSTLKLSIVRTREEFLKQLVKQASITSIKPSVEDTASLEEWKTQIPLAARAIQNQRYSEAATILEPLYYRTDEAPGLLYEMLGLLFEETRQDAKALAVYRQGFAQYPESVGLRYSALLYRYEGLPSAQYVLTTALEKPRLPSPIAAKARYMLGTLYAQKQDYSKAIAYLKPASAVLKDNAAVFYNLAAAYAGSNDVANAKTAFQQAQTVGKNDAVSQQARTQLNALKK